MARSLVHVPSMYPEWCSRELGLERAASASLSVPCPQLLSVGLVVLGHSVDDSSEEAQAHRGDRARRCGIPEENHPRRCHG